MAGSFSVYGPDVAELMLRLKARSVYVFVVEGERGSGGCPMVALQPTREQYIQANRELLAYMKRSVSLYEEELRRMGG